jgi:hypothetical protein
MTASIDVIGLEHLSARVRRAASDELQKAMVKNIQDAGPRIVAEMHGAAFTKIQRRAAGSVALAKKSDGIELEGGRGSSFGAVLFDGGEYGGRKSRKVVYATRSRLGKAYVVRRRTTMQFLPHLGHEGYFFWPTIRQWIPRLVKQQEAAVEKVLSS